MTSSSPPGCSIRCATSSMPRQRNWACPSAGRAPPFAELVAEMVREDLKGAQKDELVKSHGFASFERHE